MPKKRYMQLAALLAALLALALLAGCGVNRALGAIMPLPEGLSELLFAGVLGGRRLRLVRTPEGVLAPAEAD